MSNSYREFSYQELLEQIERALYETDIIQDTIPLRRYTPSSYTTFPPPSPPLFGVPNLKIKSMSTSKTYYDNNGKKTLKETVKMVYDE